MLAITERDTHTVTVMAATQVLKTEFLLNTACYFIHQDPSPILFIQPTQGAAESFSKERFAPTVAATPILKQLIEPARSRTSENTVTHKAYPGGAIDFVGANSPTDLASRPKRIILADEIDKYPPSAGSEGDPLKLGEERASTYHALGRAKFARACSPTEEGTSRIGREYAASDRRKCFIACQHCGHEQVLNWSHVTWDKGPGGEHLADTAAIRCESCGVVWSERDRQSSLAALADRSDKGWRQTREFFCCEELRVPDRWTAAGRAYCKVCEKPAPYNGHAGFVVSKLYSARHRLAEIVREFLDARHDAELLRKFTNTALAELWKPRGREGLDGTGLISRAENYGPDDLPDEVQVVTGFADVQGDRLEVQAIAWGADEEAWPFLYEIIQQDPAQPAAWKELDALTKRIFKTREGRLLRFAAFGIDTGGHHGAQVYAFCRTRRRRRIFPTKGFATGPLWTPRPSRSKTNDAFWKIGTNAAKDAVYARLRINPPEAGQRKPGYIHFPAQDNFGPDYFSQLTVEVRETHRRGGQPYTVWVCPEGKRNEALDTFVGSLAVRRSLPRSIERTLEFSLTDDAGPSAQAEGEHQSIDPTPPRAPRPPSRGKFLPRRTGWLK
jgi:phage terminase large subunit GpA-like protein